MKDDNNRMKKLRFSVIQTNLYFNGAKKKKKRNHIKIIILNMYMLDGFVNVSPSDINACQCTLQYVPCVYRIIYIMLLFSLHKALTTNSIMQKSFGLIVIATILHSYAIDWRQWRRLLRCCYGCRCCCGWR